MLVLSTPDRHFTLPHLACLSTPCPPPLLQAAGQAGAALDSVRWGADYLMKVHRPVPDTNQSLLVTRVRRAGWGKGDGDVMTVPVQQATLLPAPRPPSMAAYAQAHPPTLHSLPHPSIHPTYLYRQVGDIDTEMMLWYRPEEQALPRPAYAVDLTTGGSGAGWLKIGVGKVVGGGWADGRLRWRVECSASKRACTWIIGAQCHTVNEAHNAFPSTLVQTWAALSPPRWRPPPCCSATRTRASTRSD